METNEDKLCGADTQAKGNKACTLGRPNRMNPMIKLEGLAGMGWAGHPTGRV